MRLSKQGLEALKSFEGYRDVLYNDAAGYCTIGYGHLVHRKPVGKDPFKEGFYKPRITEDIGSALLRLDAMKAEYWVNKFMDTSLMQSEFDALVCFVFNVGPTAFKHSTLRKVLNSPFRTEEKVFTEFRRWVYSNRKVIQGLINRREKEIQLWKGIL